MLIASILKVIVWTSSFLYTEAEHDCYCTTQDHTPLHEEPNSDSQLTMTLGKGQCFHGVTTGQWISLTDSYPVLYIFAYYVQHGQCEDSISGTYYRPTRRRERLILDSDPLTTWSSWHEWSTCSATCDQGIQARNRTCQLPADGTATTAGCTADLTQETRDCTITKCADVGWYEWQSWGDCSATCGNDAFVGRRRNCSLPNPADCTGKNFDIKLCDYYHTYDCSYTLGVWTEWLGWGNCTLGTQQRQCGNGVRFNFRNCSTTASNTTTAGHLVCPGKDFKPQGCVIGCPVDGGWGNWTDWSQCSRTCDEGVQTRTRTCDNPPPQNGGANCTDNSTETKPCKLRDHCPVDGVFLVWSAWSQCTETCGASGYQFRSRQCSGPNFGGTACVGDHTETQLCSIIECPVAGNWGLWTQWNTCSKPCGSGLQSRQRFCNNPAPKGTGPTCPGDGIDVTICNLQPCKVDGGWSSWTLWSNCTCNGMRVRARVCDNPAPVSGGAQCQGNIEETEQCTSDPDCPQNGNWESWESWMSCSVTCGNGTARRVRTCTNPTPKNHGLYCLGSHQQNRTCSHPACQVDGGWSGWSNWGACTKSCDQGRQSRDRTCTEPAPAYGGAQCSGTAIETTSCFVKNCPVNGNWENWSPWGVCDTTCGNGTQARNRSCSSPSPAFGGHPCQGADNDHQNCSMVPCPVNGYWADWGSWSSCMASCGDSVSRRTRTCSEPAPEYGGKPCEGDSDQTNACNNGPCPVDGAWSVWLPWTDCDKSCGNGTRLRYRTCDNPKPAHHGNYCNGAYQESGQCSTQPCPVDGNWSSWLEWTDCSKTCGLGTKNRYRVCDNPKPLHGGQYCPGIYQKFENCTKTQCSVDGGWSQWQAWGSCSVTCEDGVQTRDRTCTQPAPQNGGAQCSGPGQDTKPCSGPLCPVDGGWTQWLPWVSCGVTCGDGTRTRARVCANPPPHNGGSYCTGDTRQSQPCSLPSCPVASTGSRHSATSPPATSVTAPETTSTATSTVMASTSVTLMSTTATSTVTKPTNSTPIRCQVCDGPSQKCLGISHEATCDPPYCVNELTNYPDGRRILDRRCGSKVDCNKDWWIGTSDTDKCMDFQPGNIYATSFHCVYCCVSDNCNKPIVPADHDLYQP